MNLLSQTPPRFVDTDIKIYGLGLTNNVLLVAGSEVGSEVGSETGPEMIAAWLVDGISDNRRAGRGDSIWTVSITPRQRGPVFSVEGGVGVIWYGEGEDILYVYDTRTGEALEPAQAPPPSSGFSHSLAGISWARKDPYNPTSLGGGWDPLGTAFEEGWINGREGKHLLWLPVGWRDVYERGCFSDIDTVHFSPESECGPVVIKLY